MTVEDVRDILKNESLTISDKGWTILDTHGEETFGLSFARIKEVARNLPCDAALADELYSDANHDMKALATYIDQPESYTKDELQKRADQLYPSPFAEKFCQNVIARSEYAVHFIDSWAKCQDGDFRCYAYFTLAEVAKNRNKLSDEFFANYLKSISGEISDAPPIVRDAMSIAMKNIANREDNLKKICDDISAKFNAVQMQKLGRSEIMNILSKSALAG